MRKLSLITAFLSLVASAPAFSDTNVVSLHSIVHMAPPISWFEVSPVLAAIGLLTLAGTIVYRLKRAG